MSKPHILLYTDDPELGGVAHYNHAILMRLAAEGYQTTVVQSYSNSPLIEQQRQQGICQIWIDFDTTKEFGRTLTDTDTLEAIVHSIQPDLILFSDCCPFSNFAAKQVALASKIPYICAIGFVAPYLAERFADRLDALSQQYAQAKAVIAVSQENLDLLHHQFSLPKYQGQVIHYGRPKPYFAPRNPDVRENLRREIGVPSDGVLCLTAARLELVKGHSYQLAAMMQLHQTPIWDKLYFAWAGEGSLKEPLVSKIQELGIADHVRLLGHRWDVPDWQDAADIFAMPSQLEGMPLAVMEAMAKGVPVIASAVSGIPEELGDTGKLLPDPKLDPQATVNELAKTLSAWAENSELRQAIGEAGRQRAINLFSEELMVKKTLNVVERSLLLSGDYVSPGLTIVKPDAAFPHLIKGNPYTCGWQYLRREVSHNWYVDERQQMVGFLSRDEAHILYNNALKFEGKKALEIGCWMGWSACHLALAGVELDVVDPLLERSEFYQSVSYSLQKADVLNSVNLAPGFSPQKIEELAAQFQRKWSFIFIDGNHDAPGPLQDAVACEQYAEPDAMIMFHDLASPDVAQGLDYLKDQGWNTLVYQTMQIMGVAWRGNVTPVRHQPDPTIDWSLPSHLNHYVVSGMEQRSEFLIENSRILSSIGIISLKQLETKIKRHWQTLDNSESLTQLQQLRQLIAHYLLKQPSDQLQHLYSTHFKQIYQLILRSRIQYEVLTNEEQDWIDEIVSKISSNLQDERSISALLAVMLYYRPEQLSWEFKWEEIPTWFVDDYLEFMMSPPVLFQKVGDADRYYQFMQRWVNGLHNQIFAKPDSSFWQQIAIRFASAANFIPLYFNLEALKEIYIKRAEIMSFALTREGYELDYEFPARSDDRQKIRLGILAAHFSPQSETFASLTSYKYLNRDEFEIILFSLTETYHRLERYCIGHADAFVVLSGDLKAQVQTVRQADLDILYVITNITAVSNAIALLALHRLARIQVINVCSCTSTGMKHADYYISGRLTEPEQQQHYTEQLLLIDGPAHCYDLATEEFARPTVSISRSNLGIGEDEIVYISGANFFKILPEVEVAWVQTLLGVPNSKLILYPFNPNWAESYPKVAFKQRLQHTLKEYGIAPDRVIVLEPVPSYGDVKERLKLADVYLDAFPFAGATSLIDPLTLGLPTVVMDGNAFRSRMGAAFLRELQMPELIATNVEEYIKLTIALGTHPELRRQRREKILQQMQSHPKFVDSRHYSAEHGAIFQKLFCEYQFTQLQQEYRLRSINLLVLPNWNQPEEDLLQMLMDLLTKFLSHADRGQMTMILSIGNMEQETADDLVGSIVMHLLTEAGIEIGDEEPEISLIGNLSLTRWQQLLPHLSARIPLEDEDSDALEVMEQALRMIGLDALPIYR